jgi:hypothetical protein
MDIKIALIGVLLAAALIPMTAIAATVTIRPDSQGYYTAWTNAGCGSGSNEWQCVDENPANTSDYLYTSSSSTKETFGFQNVSLTSEAINSLTLYYYAKYYSGNRYNMQPLIRSGGTDYSGSTFSTTSSYAYYSQAYTTNPATGSAWTVGQINGLEAGMVASSSKPGAYVAQVYAVVDYSPLDTCSDSDGGNVPFTFGTTSGYLNGTSYSHNDYCVDSGNIMEYYCSGNYEQSQQESCGTDGYVGANYCMNGSVYRNWRDYYCASGACAYTDTPALQETCQYNCSNGTCTGPPDSCSDTDGFNTLVQGTVSGYYFGSPYSYTDWCVTNSSVAEWYCSGTHAYNVTLNCINATTTCLDGACV